MAIGAARRTLSMFAQLSVIADNPTRFMTIDF
jgi:hypothetical protein